MPRKDLLPPCSSQKLGNQHGGTGWCGAHPQGEEPQSCRAGLGGRARGHCGRGVSAAEDRASGVPGPHSYTEVANNVQKEETVLNIQFVLLDCSHLKFSLVQHCNEWQNKFTSLLKEMAAKHLLDLHSYLQENGEKYARRGWAGAQGRSPRPAAAASPRLPLGSATLPRPWRNWGSACSSWKPFSMTCPIWRPRSRPSTNSSPFWRSTRCRLRTM